VQVWAKNPISHYEPTVVELLGIIEQQTFAGRPGYESIKNGDEIEHSWFLRLDKPIDVEVSKNNRDGNAEVERNVKVIQLASYSKKIKSSLSKSVFKKVVLKGHFFHAFSAHHHARVLMLIESIR